MFLLLFGSQVVDDSVISDGARFVLTSPGNTSFRRLRNCRLLNSKVRAVQSPVAWFALLAAGATEKHIEPDKSVKFIRLEVQYSMSQIGGSQPNLFWVKRSD